MWIEADNQVLINLSECRAIKVVPAFDFRATYHVQVTFSDGMTATLFSGSEDQATRFYGRVRGRMATMGVAIPRPQY